MTNPHLHVPPAGDPSWITRAVLAIRQWGPPQPVTAGSLAQLLSTWRWAERLSRQQRADVVATILRERAVHRCTPLLQPDRRRWSPARLDVCVICSQQLQLVPPDASGRPCGWRPYDARAPTDPGDPMPGRAPQGAHRMPW